MAADERDRLTALLRDADEAERTRSSCTVYHAEGGCPDATPEARRRRIADRLIAAGVTFATPRPAEIDVERLVAAEYKWDAYLADHPAEHFTTRERCAFIARRLRR